MSTNPVRQSLRDAVNVDIQDPTTRRTRISPRKSDGKKAAQTNSDVPLKAPNQTTDLRKPITPLRRASSAGPSSTRQSAHRTPGTANKANGSGRKAVVVTPHGRAAQRELDLRRAGFTPGKDRRRSGRQQRETPRDTLRQLSRHLAPKTHPTVPTPEGQAAPLTRSRFRIQAEDDLDYGPELQRPRLSLPLDEYDDDDDDSLLLPPHSAGLEDENFTVQSVELGRRAVSEQPPGRLSRGSFGSIRMSDVFADLNETMRGGPGGDVYDSSYIIGDDFAEAEMANMLDDGPFQAEHTGTLRDFGLDQGIFSLASGRDSDIRPENVLADDTENTFVFTVPSREPLEASVPEITEQSLLDPMQELEEPLDIDDEVDDKEQEQEEAEEEQYEQSDAEGPGLASSPKVVDGNLIMQDTTMQGFEVAETTKVKNARKKKVKISKHGIQYPSLPAGVVKKLATTFARTAGNKAKINKEALDAIMQASDWFFEQVSDDLGAYAKHAGRKTIDESDIATLMARQRQTNATTTPFSLAQRYLPRELLQELRMVPPAKLKKARRPMVTVEVAEED